MVGARLIKTLTTLLLGKTVERVVALTELADEARQGEDGGLAGDHATVGIDVGDGDLDGSVVLGLDDAASGGALAGDVKVNKVSLLHVDVCSADRFEWRNMSVTMMDKRAGQATSIDRSHGGVPVCRGW